MLPGDPLLNPLYGFGLDSVVHRYEARSPRVFSYHRYLLLIEFRHVVFRALLVRVASALTPLRYHVSCIVGLCTEKQMIRIGASRCVAVMQDAQSLWNRPSVKFPRESVNPSGNTVNVQDRIPVVVLGSRPQPTPSHGLGHNLTFYSFFNGLISDILSGRHHILLVGCDD